MVDIPSVDDSKLVTINARTFQEALGKLAETMAQKVKREGTSRLPAPQFVADDIHVMIRHALAVYKVLFYLNADDRRDADPFWQDIYTVTTAPLVRSMIDCLYNIVAILQNPASQGRLFRESGLRNWQKAMSFEKQRYGGKSPEWDDFIRDREDAFNLSVRTSGVTVKKGPEWPTLGHVIFLYGNYDRGPVQSANNRGSMMAVP